MSRLSFSITILCLLLFYGTDLSLANNAESMRYIKNSSKTEGMKNLDSDATTLNQYQSLNQSSKQYVECVKRSLHGDKSAKCGATPDADACVGALKALRYSKRTDHCVFKMHRYCQRVGYKQNTQLGWFNVAQKHFENAAVCLHRKSGRRGTDDKRDRLFSLDGFKVEGAAGTSAPENLSIQVGKSSFRVDDEVRKLDDGSEEFNLERGTILSEVLSGKRLDEIIDPPGATDEINAAEEIEAEETESDSDAEGGGVEFAKVRSRPRQNDRLSKLMNLVNLSLLSDAEKRAICGHWGFLSKEEAKKLYAGKEDGVDRGAREFKEDFGKLSRRGIAMNLYGVDNSTSLFAAVHNRYQIHSPKMLGVLSKEDRISQPKGFESMILLQEK